MSRRYVAGARLIARGFLLSLLALGIFAPLGPQRVTAQNGSADKPQKVTEGLLVASAPDGRSLGVCPLAHTAVKAQISGFMSRVRVTQEFQNPYTDKIEAVYLFPLPANAAVDDMRIQVGDHVVVGRIMRRAEARQVYNQARSEGKVAAILDQERPNIFTQAVANIMPGEKVIVQISYVETLKYEDGSYEFVFPMVVGARYNPAPQPVAVNTDSAETGAVPEVQAGSNDSIGGAQISPQPSPSGSTAPAAIPPPVLPPDGMRAGHDISLELDVDAGVPINEFTAKSHEVNVERQTASRALISLKDEAVIPNKDFVFRYDVAGQTVSDALLTHKDERGGYFTMILQPPDRVTMADVTPKELVFVVDTSGSMGGFPLEHARATILFALEHLNPGDTFNLITFSGDEHILFKEPVPATAENVAKAKRFLEEREAGGGTEMMKAIRAALDPSDAQNHLRIVCFATDGQVGNDQEIIAEVQKHQNARVFALGFGYSPNRFLLDKMAEYGRGEVDYIAGTDAGQKAAERFYERVRDPLLTNISVDWGGLPVTDVYPKRINDLFRSKPVVLSGRFSGDAKGKIRLRGMMSGREAVREIPVDLSAANDEHDTLATLWARRKIDDLMAQDYDGAARGQMKDGLDEAVTKIGLEYRLMTQFTSFVAVDESTITPPVEPKRVDVPVEANGDQVLNSTEGSLSTTIDSKKILNLPLMARDPSGLLQVAPGAVSGSVNVVNVTSSASAVDTSANTSGTNVSTEQFSNFPTQRTVQSLYSIAPTVSRSGLRDASGRDRDPSVSGSSGPENNYILDGVNTSDPAFGGSGANLPYEFVQEVEIKTGAYGAEYGKSTGGIFNVVTKSGGNEFRGDLFGYFTTRGLVRSNKQFPFTGSASDGFSEIDAGIDFGGPIKKDKLWFFGAFNPQRRKNFLLTQTFHAPVENEITTPFYAGKVNWSVNNNHTFTFSTFGDFTKQKGFLFGGSGFGTDLSAFRGTAETGGHNYAARMNSTFTPNMIGEFAFGLHLQRANILPESATGTPLITDNFAVVRNGLAVAPTHSGVVVDAATGTGDFINGANSTLARGLVRGPGFGLFSRQDRDRWELSARMQNIWGRHTLKYGFEYGRNSYGIDTISTGSPITYGGIQTLASRITNNFGVCVIQGTNIVCPVDSLRARIQALLTAGVNLGGPTSVTTDPAVSSQLGTTTNPFLIRTSTRVRDFRLHAPSTHTNVESFYVQDEFKLTRNITLNGGLRWDFQQAFGSDRTYVRLNNFTDNLQPRLGIIWDFTGKGKGKLYLNYARFLETPLPLDLNVRAGSDTSQTDLNFNVDTINAPAGSTVVADFGNLGSAATLIDRKLKPQSLNEFRGGFEYEILPDLTLGVGGVYRAQGSVIEDGSFDDGQHFFLFNPGESSSSSLSCQPAPAGAGQCFGRARRYYRALEVTATKRFSNNFQFIASYVFSSLTGNYEGLFSNDDDRLEPNGISLFDLTGFLSNTYGRLPNDRPHQFKFDGTYRAPFKLTVGGSFRAQSGTPFNRSIPHYLYGDNEGFSVPRGSAVVPVVTAVQAGFPNLVGSVGSTRTPATWTVDMNAYYPIEVGDHRELRLQMFWFNVFNHQRAIRLDEAFQLNNGLAGVPPGTNPFYGAGTIFQFPSSFNVGVKFSF